MILLAGDAERNSFHSVCLMVAQLLHRL